jgi:very-short-patch-repair endonuclease
MTDYPVIKIPYQLAQLTSSTIIEVEEPSEASIQCNEDSLFHSRDLALECDELEQTAPREEKSLKSELSQSSENRTAIGNGEISQEELCHPLKFNFFFTIFCFIAWQVSPILALIPHLKIFAFCFVFFFKIWIIIALPASWLIYPDLVKEYETKQQDQLEQQQENEKQKVKHQAQQNKQQAKKEVERNLIKQSTEPSIRKTEKVITKIDKIGLKQFSMGIDTDLVHRPAKEGAYDQYLIDELKRTFTNTLDIRTEKRLGSYSPDVIVHDCITGLWVDIEVDEPWHRRGKGPPLPSHYIGLDKKRDDFFTGKGWIVIRFAESQICESIEDCLLTVAVFLDQYRQNKILSEMVKKRFPSASHLHKVACWTKEEATQIKRVFDRDLLE